LFSLLTRYLLVCSWAIRNCGLLLLRSLIDRLFGTSESKTTTEAGWDGKSVRLDYDKYPEFPEFLMEMLKQSPGKESIAVSTSIGSIETVFPALDIIRRAGPPPQYAAQIQVAVHRYLGNNVWHVRDIAARTMSTLIPLESFSTQLSNALDGVGTSNKAHGVFMLVANVLERLLVAMASLENQGDPGSSSSLTADVAIENLQALENKIASGGSWTELVNSCPDVRAVYDTALSALVKAFKVIGNGVSAVKIDTPHVDELTLDSSALSRLAFIDHCIAQTAAKGNVKVLHDYITDISRYISTQDVDAAASLIQAVRDSWPAKNLSTSDVEDLLKIYLDALQEGKSSIIKAIALKGVEECLEELCERGDFRTELVSHLVWFPKHVTTPEIVNSQLSLSGSLLLCHLVSQSPGAEGRISDWGIMLGAALAADNVSYSTHVMVTGY
jgi:hypothetical protein